MIETHLQKILDSDGFVAADGLRRLLRFVVQETIAGRGEDIKEYSLGVAVLGKGESFDPKADPIVRVQMRRVREHLAHYYAGDGGSDSLIIEIPKGRYMPSFRSGAAAGSSSFATEEDETPLIGRHLEIAALQSAFASAAGGKGRIICLAGEAGIGKTSLAEKFLRLLPRADARCYVGRGRCSESLVGTDAYLPVLEAIEDVVRSGGAPVRRLMAHVAPTWHQQVLPLPTDRAALLPEHRVASPQRFKREFAAFLKALARDRPVVFVLDDLHWADVSTLDALAYAGPRCTADRILIIGTYRPAELQLANPSFAGVKLELQTHGVWHEVSVGLLTGADIERYVALQFPDHRFPPELAPRIHARTGGNPLFMADLVRLLRDRGVFARRDGHWTMTGGLEQVERDLPESVRSMVQKKISDLSDDDRKLMSAAAVLGPHFDSGVLASGLGLDPNTVEERLEALDRASGIVRLGSLEYSFAHALYHSALMEGLTPARKAALSLSMGEALLAARGAHASEIASQLALLFDAGRDFARASDFFLLASQNAARMYAVEQAIALARQSIESAEKLDGRNRHSRVFAAALQSALQHQSITRLTLAVADFERAERAAQALGDSAAQVNAIFGQAAACFLAKRIADVEARGRRAMLIANTSGPSWAVASSNTILALERVCSGDVAAAERQLDQAIPVLRQSGIVPQALVAQLVRGLMHTWRLEHHEADVALQWAREMSVELRANFELLIACWHQARGRGNQGRLSDSWEMLEDALRLADLLGDRFWRPRIENTRGWLLGEVFDMDAALRMDTGAVRMAHEFGDVEAECNSHINAGRDYLLLGEPDNALLHLQRAEALYRDDVWFRWVYYPRLQAEMAGCWLAKGDLLQAHACARLSLDAAERTANRKRIASARKVLGEIAVLEDRTADARGEFNAALAILDRHTCPTIEWQILLSAGALAEDEGRRDLLARAASIVQELARSIRQPDLQASFLRSKAVRDLLD